MLCIHPQLPQHERTSCRRCAGAYGQGAWLNSQPAGDHTGMSVNMLKQVGDKLDVVNVMSYGEIGGRSGQQAGCCRSAGLCGASTQLCLPPAQLRLRCRSAELKLPSRGYG